MEPGTSPSKPEPEREFLPFPKMIYHREEGNRIVGDSDELELYLALGWETMPGNEPAREELISRIRTAEEVLRQLRAELAAIDKVVSQEGNGGEDPESPSPGSHSRPRSRKPKPGRGQETQS